MRIRIVDAFTDRPFSGNPAGVVLLPDGPGASGTWPDESWMQRVAAEVNLSETAFVTSLPAGAGADHGLRWFTPVAEVAMCGHATLAAAHVLYSTGQAAGPVRFATRSGVLTTAPGENGCVVMDFPTAPLTPLPAPPGLAGALGARPVSVHDTGPDVGDLLVELGSEKEVRELAPDHAALAPLGGRGVVVTARAARDGAGYDFVSRAFFPALGIAEDPVTGSAHTALAPFWAARLGRQTLTGLQASARTGLVRLALAGNRTQLSGPAVTVIDGELLAGR